MKRRDVILSPDARVDLSQIYSRIADAGSPTNALRYIERIAAFCEKMDIASERGTRRDDLRTALRVIGFERRVSIAFVVEAEAVVILRIFYGGRDWEQDFR